jgi:hypothetical protein
VGVDQPGGPEAGVQLWWSVPRGVEVVSASAVLEVLDPPASGGVRWGLQARDLVAEAQWVTGEGVTVELLATGSSRLVDIAAWMELDEPPSGAPVVARWSQLQFRTADRVAAAVEAVMVTFPTGRAWRRLDVQVDEVGVLMVTNTRRRTRNQAVLTLPAAG